MHGASDRTRPGGPVVKAWDHRVPMQPDVWRQVDTLAAVPGVERIAVVKGQAARHGPCADRRSPPAAADGRAARAMRSITLGEHRVAIGRGGVPHRLIPDWQEDWPLARSIVVVIRG